MNHHVMHRLAAALVAASALLAACGKQEAPAPAQSADATAPEAAAAPAAAPEPAAAPAEPAAEATTGTAGPEATEPAPATPAAASAPVPAPGPSTQSTPPASPTAMPAGNTLAATVATPARPATPAAATATTAGDPGTLVRADSLREKPASDARELAALAGGSKVSVLGREGAWYKVSAGGKTGWVRMLSVRRSAGASSSSIGGIAGIASGRTGTGSVVTTTGVRGLDSEDLKTAAFNEQRVAKAESLRVDRATADAFAQAGGLKKQNVPDLPAAK